MIEKEKYEARYLLSIVSAIINQTEIPRSVRKLNWENIYKLSEYHKVAHIMYLATLGLEEDIAPKWKQLFRERYEESLMSQERFRNAAEVVMWQLKQNKIHALLIKDGIMSTCYEPREIRALNQVCILVGEGQEAKIHSMMRSMDFQKQENRKARGEAYYRVPKTTVVYYTDLGFRTKQLRKYFDFPVKVIRQMEGEKYLHQFTEDEFFIYLMCDLVNQYACAEITISNMVDYWQFYKAYKDRLNWEYIDKELATAGILDFSHRLQNLANIWFGGEKQAFSREYEADADVYQAMEMYILTRGIEGREASTKLTELVKEVSDMQARKRREERMRRFRGFLFPDRKYMENIFPILEDAPFLMPLCWLWRSLLLTLMPIKKKIYRMFNPMRRKISDMVENAQVRREEKLMKRMDEAVRQVMEESSSSVSQEVHDILDEGGENMGWQEDGAHKSDVQGDDAQKDDAQEDDAQEDGVQEDGVQEDDVQEDGAQKDDVQEDGAQKDNVQQTGPQEGDSQKNEGEIAQQPEVKSKEVYGMKDFFSNPGK